MEGRIFLVLFWWIEQGVFLAGMKKKNVKSNKNNQKKYWMPDKEIAEDISNPFLSLLHKECY